MVAIYATRAGESIQLANDAAEDFKVDKKSDVMVVDSAHGDHFDAHYARPVQEREAGDSLLKPYFDGSASWFT